MQWLQLPPRVCDFVVSFLAHRTFCIRVGKERTGHFVTKRGVPQGSVLAPILFNIAQLPLAWQLASIPDAFFLLYADDLTVWTLHPDLQRQQHALQSALDKASDWCARIGLTLSATKTAFMSITNRRGRRRLLQTPICLSLNGQALSTVSTIRVLGVELDASGSASAWSQAVPAAAALAHYYNSTLPQPAAPLPEIPPWLKAQASDNRPLTRLRQSNRQAEQEAVVTTIDDSLAVYVDAAIDNCVLHTSLVCPTLPETQHTCSYVTEAPFPSVLAELTAIRDGLTLMIPKVDCLSLNRLLVYTDSTQAVRELRKVSSSLDIASDVHRLIYSCACPVRVLWTRRSTLAQMAADAACHPAEVQHPLPLLRFNQRSRGGEGSRSRSSMSASSRLSPERALLPQITTKRNASFPKLKKTSRRSLTKLNKVHEAARHQLARREKSRRCRALNFWSPLWASRARALRRPSSSNPGGGA
ncbi:hypothetical protein HPB52_020468 [Rhipicephalus sanguineus]|uniref:Reverse transcriptase domain-containing protein n=1 Tax=Rhipicephalus sanguineus TaxID=34632 RepID=A0A9D4QHG7_RHISA|nr:hypothetical protein HPB52_020468 [Rhipicephalus sanguineus]